VDQQQHSEIFDAGNFANAINITLMSEILEEIF